MASIFFISDFSLLFKPLLANGSDDTIFYGDKETALDANIFVLNGKLI